MTRPTKERIEEIREWAARRSADYTSGASNALELLAALDAVTADRAAVLEEAAEAAHADFDDDEIEFAGSSFVDWLRARAAQLRNRKEGGTKRADVEAYTDGVQAGRATMARDAAEVASRFAVTSAGKGVRRAAEKIADAIRALVPLRTSGKEGP